MAGGVARCLGRAAAERARVIARSWLPFDKAVMEMDWKTKVAPDSRGTALPLEISMRTCKVIAVAPPD